MQLEVENKQFQGFELMTWFKIHIEKNHDISRRDLNYTRLETSRLTKLFVLFTQ